MTARLFAGFIALSSAGAGTGSSAEWQAQVAPQLLSVWKAAQVSSANVGRSSSSAASVHPTSTYSARYDSHGRLQMDVWFDCAASAPSAQLVAAGMILGTTLKATPMCVVEGWANVSAIPALASLAGVKKIELPHYRVPKKHIARKPAPLESGTSAVGANTIDGNGIAIMAADQYATNTGVNGAGLTVAVISDDVENIAVIQGRGELPMVNIVQPSANPTPHTTFTDEGTMMLEEVYAVAPGADLAFCGPETYTEYVGCVTNLIAAGASIVSDDLSFPGFDTMSSQNAATEAVQALLAANPQVMLFTAAGNQQENYWQGPYTADNSSGASFTCNGQRDTYFENFGTADLITWTLNDASSALLMLAWADPFGANVSNFDLYAFDATTLALVACTPGAGSSETFDYFLPGAVNSPGSYYLVIGTPDASLNGKFLKLMGFGDGAESFSVNTSGGPNSPQDFASGVFTVGAVDGSDGIGNTIEPYSNTGPIQLELPKPSTLPAPIVTAPDGVLVDAVGTAFESELSSGLFYGTSAASPNTAAVAALLRSAFPTLTPAATITAIEAGATAIAAYGAVPNGTIGYGRVNAIGALGALSPPTLSPLPNINVVGGSSSPPVAFTVNGVGNLRIAVQSAVLAIPATLNPATGTAGITVAPASCGAPTMACTVSVTPALGGSGTGQITLSVTDGANRTASAASTVTVRKPPVPTITITAGGSQTVASDTSATTPVSLSLSGTGPLDIAVTSSNPNLATAVVSNTCANPTSIRQCTANVDLAGSSGTAAITFTVSDYWGSSSKAVANVSVSPPPSSGGGGGSVDGLLLLILACVRAMRPRNSSPWVGDSIDRRNVASGRLLKAFPLRP